MEVVVDTNKRYKLGYEHKYHAVEASKEPPSNEFRELSNRSQVSKLQFHCPTLTT